MLVKYDLQSADTIVLLHLSLPGTEPLISTNVRPIVKPLDLQNRWCQNTQLYSLLLRHWRQARGNWRQARINGRCIRPQG